MSPRLPERDLDHSKSPTMYAGLVGADGSLQLYDGNLRFVGRRGRMVADHVRPEDYAA